MSAPDAKAPWPAPRKTTTRTRSSAASIAIAEGKALHISRSSALRFPGLSIAMVATAPARVIASLLVAEGRAVEAVALAFIGDRGLEGGPRRSYLSRLNLTLASRPAGSPHESATPQTGRLAARRGHRGSRLGPPVQRGRGSGSPGAGAGRVRTRHHPASI